MQSGKRLFKAMVAGVLLVCPVWVRAAEPLPGNLQPAPTVSTRPVAAAPGTAASGTSEVQILQKQVIRSIVFSGNTVFTGETLLGVIKSRPGQVLDRETVAQDLAAITNKYKEAGYNFGQIYNANLDTNGVLHFNINEGILEDIIITGNIKTKENVITRELLVRKGAPLNSIRLGQSLQRLRNTGYFGDIETQFYQGKLNPNNIIMNINVDEQKTGLINLGAGYSNSNGLVGILGYSESNLNGRGDSFGVNWEFGGKTGANNYTVSYNHPWVNKFGDALGFSIFDREYNYDDYNQDGDSVAEYYKRTKGANITYAFARKLFVKDYVTLETKNTDYSEYKAGYDYRQVPDYLDSNFGWTHSLSWSHVFGNRDSFLNPTQGKRLSLTGIMAGHGLGGDFNYYKLLAESRTYYKVGHAQVLAARLQGGIGFGDIPDSDLFTLGGAGNLRGYEDDQFRGTRFYEGTLEYRYPIAKKIEGVIFADAGSVWDGTDNLFWYQGSRELYYAGGLGLRIKTPIGPINLNYGYGTKGGKFHFTFGGQF